MNVFRLAGDLTHLLAIIILLVKIWKTKSCAGISGRSQILFLMVYTMRYLDLFTHFISLYNSVMKAVFIGSTLATLYMIHVIFKTTYDNNHDTFRIEFLIFPVFVLAVFMNYDFRPLEVLWTFSIYLESVAILPQLVLVYKTREIESMILYYLLCLGSYRGFYILNWVYRYYIEGFYDLISIIGGVVQTVLYCGFFLLYITKVKSEDDPQKESVSREMDLPHGENKENSDELPLNKTPFTIKMEPFDALHEHRPLYLWIPSDRNRFVTGSKENSLKYIPSNIPGWKIYLKSFLQNVFNKKGPEIKDSLSKEQTSDEKSLLEKSTGPV